MQSGLRSIITLDKKKKFLSGGNIKTYLLLHIILFGFSLSSVCSKVAAKQEFLSFKFILFYGLVLFILFVYAIAWQQVLKRLPLVTAYANKAVTVIWGLVFGLVFFQEKITVQKVIGAVIIILGVYLIVSDGEETKA